MTATPAEVADWTAERITALRRRLGWSQSQLAHAVNDRTGMHANRHRVSEWESGRISPSLPVRWALDRIASE